MYVRWSAAQVLTEVDVEDPVHGLDSPVSAYGLGKATAGQIDARDIESGVIRFLSVRMLRDARCIADGLHPRPLFLEGKVTG